MTYQSDESKELYKVLVRRGYRPELCMLISITLNTTWTANRMLGYLKHLPRVKEEEIIDEMLAILEHRRMIRDKNLGEYYQAKINEFYMYGFDE